jgi:hypothetical protein
MFYQRVFKLLEDFNYAVVGGFALVLHGAVRGTVDLDIIISFKKEDFIEIERRLKSLGLTPRLPIKADEIFNFRKEYIKNKNLIAWSFVNVSRPDQIIDIIITHNKDKIKTKTFHIGSTKIKVATLNELIKMKRVSARPQDLEDLKQLERLKKS